MNINRFKIKMDSNSIPDVCRRMSQFDSDFDVGNNRTMIDGKSMLGFYALDTSKPLNVECVLKKNETMKAIMDSLKDYLVNE